MRGEERQEICRRSAEGEDSQLSGRVDGWRLGKESGRAVFCVVGVGFPFYMKAYINYLINSFLWLVPKQPRSLLLAAKSPPSSSLWTLAE